MAITSKYFDGIRISGRRKAAPEPAAHACQWKGCRAPATHRAPMGRKREGEYFLFCFDHVREYNKTYNYFSGLDEESIARFQKDAVTGHRPTWTLGVNPWGGQPPLSGGDPRAAASARIRARISGANGADLSRPRQPRTLDKKAFEDLGLPFSATAAEIKGRYKELVKRHHPDANGGDRSTEDRLRRIIQAYKQLRQAGFC
jgi:curved DNA-binding protein CbpA